MAKCLLRQVKRAIIKTTFLFVSLLTTFARSDTFAAWKQVIYTHGYDADIAVVTLFVSTFAANCSVETLVMQKQRERS